MSSKKNIPVIAAAVAAVVIGGGAMIYFSSNMKKDASIDPTAAAEQMANIAPTAGEEAQPADNNASAKADVNADEQKQIDAAFADAGTIDGVKVEPGNPVVARVNGQDITRVDVFRFIQMMPGNLQQLPPSTIYPLAVDQVINTRVVEAKADAAALEADPEVQKQLDMAKEQIIRGIFVQRELEKQITDADVKKAYDDFVARTPDVEEIKARHILVEDEAKAKDIITKLESGEDFAKLAKENSKDPGNKDEGGDLGWFAKQDMVPEFAEAAFKLGKGEITKTPVKTQFGYHVVKLDDKRTKPKPSFEDMKQSLRTELSRQKLEAMVQDWREAAKIERFDVNGNPIKEEAPKADTGKPEGDVAPAAGATGTDAAPAKAE